MDVVAVDFETANGNASSACQLAAVVVRDSEIVEEHSWLIRPPRMYFAPRNIAVHGIRPKDVAEAPDMEQVWSELLPVIDGQVLVAHNARFDLGVLIGSLAAYDIACPDLEFTCTRLLARCGWPGRARYGLKPLADWLGVQFRHHDALEDARACAQIAAAVEKTHEQRDLPGLEQKLRITRGAYRHSHLSSPRMIGKRRGAPANRGAGPRSTTDRWGFPDRKAKPGGVDPTAVLTAANSQQPLSGKKIVLLGPLRGLDMQQSQELVNSLGGVCLSTIDAQTDYVVACGTSLDAASQVVCQSLANTSAATTHADQVPAKAAGIRLLSERQFRALLPAGKATVRW
jgi:DNA polymerase-3 subunit epsilon